MMMSKEEYKNLINRLYLGNPLATKDDYKNIKILIESHFKLIESAKTLIDSSSELMRVNKRLVKALDKACNELEDFDMTFNNADFDDVKNKQEWKEYCIKDADNQCENDSKDGGRQLNV